MVAAVRDEAYGTRSGGIYKTPTLPRQVSAMISDEQGRRLDRIADARQLSVSAIVREAIRDYLAAKPRAAVTAQ